MAISGQIFGITDPKKFFEAVLLGQAPAGFVTLKNLPLQISAIGFNHTNPQAHVTIPGTFDSANSSFKISDFPAGHNVDDIALNVNISGSPLYRTAVFSYTRAQHGGLDIYTYQPSSVGISAGDISKNIPASSGLPSNTTLQTFPWGLWAAGDQQGADVQFGMKIVPHTSTNLNVWAEIGIDGWNIHVGFPADCKYNAHEIRLQIQQALEQENSPLNAFIKTRIMSVLTKVAGNYATDVFKAVSITFTSIRIQAGHTWPLSNKTDTTAVINVGPTIGYPQKW
jgi:hypothetical protein